MAAMQPMGIGVGRSRFEDQAIEAENKKCFQEEQRVQEALRREKELRDSGVAVLLRQEVEILMMKLYLESAEGKIQYAFIKRLKVNISLADAVQNNVDTMMGPRLSNISRTQAAPE